MSDWSDSDRSNFARSRSTIVQWGDGGTACSAGGSAREELQTREALIRLALYNCLLA